MWKFLSSFTFISKVEISTSVHFFYKKDIAIVRLGPSGFATLSVVATKLQKSPKVICQTKCNTTYEYDANGNVWQIVVECMRMLWYDL